MKIIKSSFVLMSDHGARPFLNDVRYLPNQHPKPIVLFVHGFKGFKDAMHFNAIADEFAGADFVYVKMNLSRNGTTPDHPMDFVDLEAFGHNNFTIEMDDICTVLDFIENDQLPVPKTEVDLSRIYLIGHSRGGGISILKACEDSRIKKLVTWAAVPDFAAWWSADALKDWKEKGVQYILNMRTKQEMPLYYQMVEDFQANQGRLSIPDRMKTLEIPYLAIHGTEDENVPVGALKMLKSFNANVQTAGVEGAGHTFGGSHPWTEKELQAHSKEMVKRSIDFLNL